MMKQAATRLVSLYGAQAIFTCTYITLLGIAGERFAERVRNRLFQSSKLMADYGKSCLSGGKNERGKEKVV